MNTWIALLRGINVGGRHRLPMAELREVVAGQGARDVRTYIQSGNVVFAHDESDSSVLSVHLAEAIEAHCGFEVPVVLRSGDQLQAAVEEHPFRSATVDTKRLHFGFLSADPDPATVADLDPERSTPDRFAVIGREVYLDCPNGMARTKLTAPWFDRQLGVVSTWRNWRTVGKLIELADGG